MAASRRVGSTTSKTRAAILEATERIMVEDGYAAVTSRNVAERVGIHPGNVHYYFPTLDDLFIAVLERGADATTERLTAAMASPRPLEAMWRASSHPRGVALLNELMAAANHRKPLRDVVVERAQVAREIQIEALRALLPQYGLDTERFTPELVVAAIQGTALLVVRQEALQGLAPSDTARGAAEALIDELERRRDLNDGST